MSVAVDLHNNSLEEGFWRYSVQFSKRNWLSKLAEYPKESVLHSPKLFFHRHQVVTNSTTVVSHNLGVAYLGQFIRPKDDRLLWLLPHYANLHHASQGKALYNSLHLLQ